MLDIKTIEHVVKLLTERKRNLVNNASRPYYAIRKLNLLSMVQEDDNIIRYLNKIIKRRKYYRGIKESK